MQTAQERRRVHNLFAQKPAVAVSARDLIRLRDLYERGLVRQALDLALTLGQLPAWTGARAQIMAGRVAGNLGAPRLGRWLHFRAYRHQPVPQFAEISDLHALIIGHEHERRAFQFLRQI